MQISEYASFDGTDLAELVRTKQVSTAETLDAAVTAAVATNPKLNAFVQIYPHPKVNQGLEGSPFYGVPFAYKDLGAAPAGQLQEMGSLLARGRVVSASSDLAARFDNAGLISIGRTACPEFGYNAVTHSIINGKTRNPWNLARSSGGSSGGAAAAVAAGVLSIAHGNDGGGSIRIPASYCGVVGLKPTRMRNPVGPHSWDMLMGVAVEHVLTRTVRDTAGVLDCVSGPAVGDPYQTAKPDEPFSTALDKPRKHLRVGIVSKPWMEGNSLSEADENALLSVGARLEDLGHIVKPLSLAIDSEAYLRATAVLWSVGTVSSVRHASEATGLTPSRETIEAPMFNCYEFGLAAHATDIQEAFEEFNRVNRYVGKLFQDFDVLMTPTTAGPAVPVDYDNGIDPGISALEWTRHLFKNVPFTSLFNVTGQPAISLPLLESAEGMPLGVQFVGQYGDERTLLGLAAQLEQIMPWRDRKPDAHCTRVGG